MTSIPRGKGGFSQARNLLALAAATLCCLAPLAAQTPTFTTFDAPDAGHGTNQGTVPISINQGGVIAGDYYDASGSPHSFVRAAGGQITEFDAPGLLDSYVSGINRNGQVIGSGTYVTSKGGFVTGYLRSRNGVFIHIAPPGAVNTAPVGINDSGEISGTFYDSAVVAHGFLRDASGNYSVIEEPDAVINGPDSGTLVAGINASGEVTGFYTYNGTLALRGFVRDVSGNFVAFDAPDAGTCVFCGTTPGFINLSGEVSGEYVDNSFTKHGFVRDSAGNIVTFDVSGSLGTFVNGMNDAGTVVGGWFNGATTFLGFERTLSGSTISFSAAPPDSTNATAINNSGHITGYYLDGFGTEHGFVK